MSTAGPTGNDREPREVSPASMVSHIRYVIIQLGNSLAKISFYIFKWLKKEVYFMTCKLLKIHISGLSKVLSAHSCPLWVHHHLRPSSTDSGRVERAVTLTPRASEPKIPTTWTIREKEFDPWSRISCDHYLPGPSGITSGFRKAVCPAWKWDLAIPLIKRGPVAWRRAYISSGLFEIHGCF